MEHIFNSVNLISPSGKRVDTYRKIQLTKEEKQLFNSGSTLSVVETEVGIIGMMICWDLAFPEISLELAKNHASLFLAPSAWEMPYNHSFHQFAAARALDHTVFTAASNHIGENTPLHFFGESAIYRPDGSLYSRGPEDYPAFVQAEIDYVYQNYCENHFYNMNVDRLTF
ncbi:Carbon-nitrogen hydrolase [Alteribacillus bidgolensis]|uniref:Carbon-nitrogen hydrolase n=1 Tax=Alteribacillus bidgolensis TaxID=930129 RepID=A0A1G8M610_9BACI|nr:Carbon-nitrogen hydrolase [Alteribacillus bidgolensis]